MKTFRNELILLTVLIGLAFAHKDPKKVAVVTGANRGLGFGIAKGLCEKFDGHVYLTARSVRKGEAAVNKLKELGFNPRFHQLDIANQTSINNFKKHIVDNHGGIDVLINNAAVAGKGPKMPFAQRTEQIITVNYFGTLNVCIALFPILRSNARVVQVSSTAGTLSRMPDGKPRDTLNSRTLTIQQLNKLMHQCIDSAKRGRNIEEGFGKSPYGVSKAGINALTGIQQKNCDEEQPQKKIAVNSCYPGLVLTDANPTGILSIDEGTKSALYLALEPHNLKGKFVNYDCKPIDWRTTDS